MAELIVMARNNTHPDPDIDRSGCFKKGDIVSVLDDGRSANNSGLTLPDFVVVKVNISLATAKAYRDAWRSDLQFNILSSDLATDSYQISISNANAGSVAGITRSQVEDYLTKWNLNVVSINVNEVVFNASIYQAAISQAFWLSPVDLLVFNEINYEQTGGVHTITTDYSAVPPKYWDKVSKRIIGRGGTVLSDTNQVITWTIDRSTIRQDFQQEVKESAEYIWKTRRWSFSEADVDAAIAAGGVVTQTPSQVLAKLRDAIA